MTTEVITVEVGVGSRDWAILKEMQGFPVDYLDTAGEWTKARASPRAFGASSRFRVSLVLPTLEECLNALETILKNDGLQGSGIRDILTRARRLP